MCECVHAFIRGIAHPNPILFCPGVEPLGCDARSAAARVEEARAATHLIILHIYARTVTTSAALEFVFVMYCFSARRKHNRIAKPGPIPPRAHHIHAFYLRTCIKSDCTRFSRVESKRTLLTRQDCQTVTRFQLNVILKEAISFILFVN